MVDETMSGILILDYGTGNLNSVKRTLDRIGTTATVSSRAGDVLRADKIIMPGVGHFGKAMAKLQELGLRDALSEAVLSKRIPVLGICLGMELMANTSEEGDSTGLGWIDAEAVRFDLGAATTYKVPHMGWNQVNVKKDSRLMKGIDDEAEFYFAHSYHLRVKDRADLLSETDYGVAFPSAIEKDNIFGVQYHPEKSHDAGRRVLRNFVEM